VKWLIVRYLCLIVGVQFRGGKGSPAFTIRTRQCAEGRPGCKEIQ
jgi:hypothetical protein